jgi:hypothetical protein
LAINQSTNDVYVVGQSDASFSTTSDYDIVLVKYNASGNPMWNQTWYGPTQKDDIPAAVIVDPFGYAVVCGKTDIDPTVGVSNYDWITVKYDANGIKQYDVTFNGNTETTMMKRTSLVADASGNIIVAGYVNNNVTQQRCCAEEIRCDRKFSLTWPFIMEKEISMKAVMPLRGMGMTTFTLPVIHSLRLITATSSSQKIDAAGNYRKHVYDEWNQ